MNDADDILKSFQKINIFEDNDDPMRAFQEEHDDYMYGHLKGKKIKCSWCGKTISFEESNKVEFKTYMGESSKTVQSGFPTGVRVDQVTRKYNVTEERLCRECYSKYLDGQKKHKTKKALFYALGFGAFAIIAYLALTDVISESWLFVLIIPAILVIKDLLDGK